MSLLSPMQSRGSTKVEVGGGDEGCRVSRGEGFIFVGLGNSGRACQPGAKVPQKLEKAKGQTPPWSLQEEHCAVQTPRLRPVRPRQMSEGRTGVATRPAFPQGTSGFCRKGCGTPCTGLASVTASGSGSIGPAGFSTILFHSRWTRPCRGQGL